ncbi:Rmf/CrpP family protein [Amycolatopsis keratiniphila]|uniref:Rmf/CrpP family protein n=1 Tax=Amycolatopsis keratiniphila TaxID=129921 RepID=UPI00373FD983
MSTDPRQSPKHDNTAADILGPKTVLEIQENGKRAALSGERIENCPWHNPKNETDRAKRDMWIRGFAAGRTDLRTRRSSP